MSEKTLWKDLRTPAFAGLAAAVGVYAVLDGLEAKAEMEGYDTVYNIPEDVEELELEIYARIHDVLDCDTAVLFNSKPGAVKEEDLAVEGDVLFLRNDLTCVDSPDGSSSCTSLALQYEEGEMVNGFIVSGVCVSTEYLTELEDMLNSPDISTEVDLSERIEERVVFAQ